MTAIRACALDELSPASARKVIIDGRPVAIVMDSSGTVHALGDTCTHGEISLSEGFVEDDAIECWAHGSKFALSTGTPRNFPAYEPVPVYAVTIDGADVLVDVTQNIADQATTP